MGVVFLQSSTPSPLTLLLFMDRWGIEMPAIIARSISILSDAGLGMAMFSLGMPSSMGVRLLTMCCRGNRLTN